MNNTLDQKSQTDRIEAEVLTLRIGRLGFVGLLATMLLAGCGAGASQPANGTQTASSGSTAPASTSAKTPANTPAKKLVKVTLLSSWTPFAGEMPFFLGKARGYYRDVGIDLNIVDGKGSAVTVQAIGAGHGGQFGYASIDIMALARAKGVPVIAVMGAEQRNPFGVWVDKNSSIKSLKDLPGHSIFVTPGSPETFYLPAVAQKLGFDIHSVKLIDVSGADKDQAYMSGKADAVATTADDGTYILTKRPSRFIPFADGGLVSMNNGLFVRSAYAKSHADLVRRFVAASVRAWKAVLNDPNAVKEAAADMVATHPGQGLKPQLFAQAWKPYVLPYILTRRDKGHPFGWQSTGDWHDMLTMLHDFANLRGSMKPSDYFTNAYLPAQ